MPIKPAPAVLRAMDVLQFLAARTPDSPTMSEIARGTDLSKATCHSVLIALAEGGYVRRDPTTLGYSLGPSLISLGAVASSSSRLPELARVEMEALSQTLGVPTAAAVSTGTHLLVISAVGPGQPFQITLSTGQTVPFVPPLGAAFIAWAPEREVAAWLDRAPRTLNESERHHYLAALAAIREHGYSVSLSDRAGMEFAQAVEESSGHLGLRAVQSRRDELIGDLGTNYLPALLEPGRTYRLTQSSAPVFDHTGAVAMIVLAITLGLELATDQITAYAETVRDAAQRLTQQIGGVAAAVPTGAS